MNRALSFFIVVFLLTCVSPLHAQTVKALAYNTNGQVVANTGTNTLTFTNSVKISDGSDFMNLSPYGIDGWGDDLSFEENTLYDVFQWDASGTNGKFELYVPLTFADNISQGAELARQSRTNLGLGATWLTNTNVTNFRTAIGLGENDTPTFSSLSLDSGQIDLDPSETLGQQLTGFTVTTNSVVFSIAAETFLEATTNSWVIHRAPTYSSTNIREQTRDNLLLGSTNIVTFAGLTNNGDITINQTATNNGLLYIRRTNAEPFLGLANLIASNNTTVSNETLFRVGVAEATNKSAQFGFRATNTNGNGVAVFSVFGFNALMQIGADASTNAVIYSGGGTNNEVMTLIKDGATEFARPLRFSTNAASKPATNAPANTTNVAAWVEMLIGTNSYRVPLYQ